MNGLHKAGAVDKLTLDNFRRIAEDLPPVKELSASQIKNIRQKVKVSQAVFARYLNTSVGTIQKWESGERKPGGSNLVLLNLIRRKGIEALL